MCDKTYFISVHLLVYYISVNDTSTSFPLKISVRQIVLFLNVSIHEVLLGICVEAQAGVHIKVRNCSCNFVRY